MSVERVKIRSQVLKTGKLQEAVWLLFRSQCRAVDTVEDSIGPGMWRVLMTIDYRKKHQLSTVLGDISTDLAISRQALWRSCYRLQKAGLIKIQPRGTDRRSKVALLTPAGQDYVDSCALRQINRIKSALSPSDAPYFEAFIRVLACLEKSWQSR